MVFHCTRIEICNHILGWACLRCSHLSILWTVFRVTRERQESREDAFCWVPGSGLGMFYMSFQLLYFPQEPNELQIIMSILEMRESRTWVPCLSHMARKGQSRASDICALPTASRCFPEMHPTACQGFRRLRPHPQGWVWFLGAAPWMELGIAAKGAHLFLCGLGTHGWESGNGDGKDRSVPALWGGQPEAWRESWDGECQWPAKSDIPEGCGSNLCFIVSLVFYSGTHLAVYSFCALFFLPQILVLQVPRFLQHLRIIDQRSSRLAFWKLPAPSVERWPK